MSAPAPQSCQNKLWQADPHQYGPGKVHIVDDRDTSKTFCGQLLRAVAGREATTGKATCKTCLNSFERRPERDRQQAEWQRQALDREEQRRQKSEQWWQDYNTYLRSPAWQIRREKVLRRANGRCEARIVCDGAKAAEIHHTSYRYLGAEPLWELRAVCTACHHEITAADRADEERVP